MAGLTVISQPSFEPVTLADVKNFLRVTINTDDLLIGALITAARELVEVFTGRAYVYRTLRQTLDCPPQYADTMYSQQAYPPSYYSLAQYSTNLWNYSQMIKLYAPPLVSVTAFRYVDTNGDLQTLDQSKYQVDVIGEPARLFPAPGGTWPTVAFVANAVQIDYLAGYYGAAPSQVDTIPRAVKVAIMMLVSNFYENRDAAAPGTFSELPFHVKALLYSNRVMDYSPTRG